VRPYPPDVLPAPAADGAGFPLGVLATSTPLTFHYTLEVFRGMTALSEFEYKWNNAAASHPAFINRRFSYDSYAQA
jgi:hypothetical protein